jgi:hypothetical protein
MASSAKLLLLVAPVALCGCVSFTAPTRNLIRYCAAEAIRESDYREFSKRLPLYSWTVSKGPDKSIVVEMQPPPGKNWVGVSCLVEPDEEYPSITFLEPIDMDR